MKNKFFKISAISLLSALTACNGGSNTGEQYTPVAKSVKSAQPAAFSLADIQAQDIKSLLIFSNMHHINETIPVGLQMRYKAILKLKNNTEYDVTDQVEWLSNKSLIAKCELGEITALGIGTTVISASLPQFGIMSNPAKLSVIDSKLRSIEVIPDRLNISANNYLTYKVYASYDNNRSYDVTDYADIITTGVDNIELKDNGRLYVAEPGEVQLEAIYADGMVKSNKASVNATKALKSLNISMEHSEVPANGFKHQLTAVGITNDGLVETRDPGLISWSIKSGKSCKAEISPQGIITSGIPGCAVTISGTDKQSTSAKGEVTYTTKNVAVKQLRIEKSEKWHDMVMVNNETKYKAIVEFIDGSEYDVTDHVKWQSGDDTSLLMTSDLTNGVAMPLKEGNVTVTANYHYNNQDYSNTLVQEVRDPKSNNFYISPALTKDFNIPKGYVINFSGTGITDSGSTYHVGGNDVEWKSSNDNIMSIDHTTGKAIAINPGHVTITGTYKGKTFEQTLNITNATLKELEINKPERFITNIKENLKVNGIFSDGSKLSLNNQVFWYSASNTALHLDNNSGAVLPLMPSNGTGVKVALDMAKTALLSNIQQADTIKILSPNSMEIKLQSGTNYVPVGFRVPLEASLIFDDNSKTELDNVEFSISSNPSIANLEANELKALSAGNVEVSATAKFNGKSYSGSIPIEFKEVQLSEILINNEDKLKNIGVNLDLPLSITGKFENGDIFNISNDVNVSSSNNSVHVQNNNIYVDRETTGTISASIKDLTNVTSFQSYSLLTSHDSAYQIGGYNCGVDNGSMQIGDTILVRVHGNGKVLAEANYSPDNYYWAEAHRWTASVAGAINRSAANNGNSHLVKAYDYYATNYPLNTVASAHRNYVHFAANVVDPLVTCEYHPFGISNI